MKLSFGFSTCVFIVVLITCHKFSSSEANDVDTGYAHITRLGQSPIGAQYRERRSKDEDLSANKLDDNDEEEGNDNQSEKDDDNEDDGNDDEEDDEEGEEEDDNHDELTRKHIHENLSFLRGAKKSLNRYSKGDSPLDRLVTESSDLAKEVSTVFRKLAKREAELTNEMEHLRKALDEAVVGLKKTIQDEEKAKKQQSEKEAGSDDKNGGDEGTSENGDKEQIDTQTLKRQRRNFYYNRNPYRACVSLEPMQHPDEEHHLRAHYSHNQPPPPPGVSVQEYMPSRNFPRAQAESAYSHTQQQNSYQQPPAQRPPAHQPHSQSRPVGEVDIKTITQTQPGGYKESRTFTQIVTNNQQGSNAQRSNPPPSSRALPMTSQSLSQFQNQQRQQNFRSGSGQGPNNNADAVDLSEVYWLKLDPARRQEALHDKIDTLLKRKQNAGKDVLLVPVDHGFQSTDEVRDSFLRSVRVRPKALSNKLFRKLRSLQVHIL